MRMSRFSRGPMAALAALSLVLAGCGGDSSGPDAPFDGQGTSADMSAMDDVFASEKFASFDAAAGAINSTLGENVEFAIAARPSSSALRSRVGASLYGQRVVRNFRRSGGAAGFAAAAAEADDYRGKTFVYNTISGEYEVSDRTGAPSNGVRFILYSVNPITHVPTQPLDEIGYAQVVVSHAGSSASTSASIRLTLVSENVTYIDYSVGVTANETNQSAALSIEGFVTDGTEQLNFDTRFEVNINARTAGLSFAAHLLERNFRVSMNLAFQDQENDDVLATVSLQARGEHGRVSITGNATNDVGTLTVRVNGDVFATIEATGSGDPVITGSNGQPLTAEEQQALRDIFALFDGSTDFFDHLPGQPRA